MTDYPKSTELKAATALACHIAFINSDRFNEAVAAGHYPCAPRTSPGRRRQFDVNDVIALRSYKRFLDGGMSAKAAGAKACSIRDFLQVNPDADQVYIVKTAFDDGDAESGEYQEGRLFADFDPKQTFVKINSSQSLDVVSVEVFNFHYLRGRIVHEINKEDKTAGRD